MATRKKCCCCPSINCASETACTGCLTRPTPTHFTVTLAGLTLDASCFQCVELFDAFTTNSVKAAGTIPAGPHVLEQVAACAWTKTIVSPSIAVTKYGNNDCTDPKCSTNELVIALSYSVALGRWRLLARLIEGSGGECSSSGEYLFDSGNFIDTTLCCRGGEIANMFDDDTWPGCMFGTHGFDANVFAYGGTAIIVPCAEEEPP